MAYLGNKPATGENNAFRILDDISSHVVSFNGSSASVVSVSADTITIAGSEHRYITGQKVTYSKGGGTVITGLTDATAYYVIRDSATTIQLATTASNANNGVAIDLTGLGAGTAHTLTLAFDGTNTKFKPTYNDGSQNPIITRAAQLVISVNGIIQQPVDSATPSTGFGIDVSGNIIFSTAPDANDDFWGHVHASNTVTFDISDNDIDNFTGDGSTVNFNLSKTPPDNRNILVTLDGVVQYPSDNSNTRAYTLSENELQMVSAPGNGVAIQVRHIGFAGPSAGGSSGVTGFYGRTGNVVLKSTDNPVVGNLTAVDGTFSGNVSIAKTLTYMDVAHIDAVGIITAQSDVNFNGSGAGISSAYWDSSANEFKFKDNVKLSFGDSQDLEIYHSSTGGESRIFDTGTGDLKIGGSTNVAIVNGANNQIKALFGDNAVSLNYAGNTKFTTTGTGVNITDTLNVVGVSTIGGDLYVKNTQPRIYLLDTDSNSDFSIINQNGLFSIYDDSNTAHRFNIKSTGEVGIGTDNPTNNLHLYYQGNNGVSLKMQNHEGASTLHADGDAFHVDAGAHYFRNAAGNTNRLVINSSGRVGIGTDNPAVPLHIFNTVDAILRLESSDNGAVYHSLFRDNAGTKTRIGYMGYGGTGGTLTIANEVPNADVNFSTTPSGAAAGAEETALRIGEDKTTQFYGDLLIPDKITHTGDTNTAIRFLTEDTISFETGGEERLRIGSTGKLSFDYDAAENNLVDIDLRTNNGLQIRGSNGNDNNAKLYLGGSTQNQRKTAIIHDPTTGYCRGDLHFCLENAADLTDVDVTDSKMVITAAGKVGIGITTPESLLTIRDNAAANDTPELRIESFRPTIRFSDRSTSALDAEIGADLNNIVFRISAEADNDTALDELMRIKSNGRVGIGTNNPDMKLEIWNGGIKIDRREASGTSNPHLDMRTGSSGASRLMIYAADHTDDNSDWIYKTNSNEAHIFHVAGTQRFMIQSNGDINVGVTTAYNNYASGATGTATRLAVVKAAGATGFQELAHFAGGADENNTGAILRVGQYGNDRGMYMKAGRKVGDQVVSYMGLRNSSNSDVNMITLMQDGGDYRMGINEEAPGTRLQIGGELSIKSSGECGPYLYRSNGSGPDLVFHTGRSASLTSPTASGDGDLCGNINFAGHDGSNYLRRASINGIVNGTVGANSIPIDIYFRTGATSPVERMRIAANGNIRMGSAGDPGALLHIQAANSAVYNRAATTAACHLYIVNTASAGGTGIILQGQSSDNSNTCQATISAAHETTTKDTSLTFGTRQNTNGSNFERFRITSTGQIAGKLAGKNHPGIINDSDVNMGGQYTWNRIESSNYVTTSASNHFRIKFYRSTADDYFTSYYKGVVVDVFASGKRDWSGHGFVTHYSKTLLTLISTTGGRHHSIINEGYSYLQNNSSNMKLDDVVFSYDSDWLYATFKFDTNESGDGWDPYYTVTVSDNTGIVKSVEGI